MERSVSVLCVVTPHSEILLLPSQVGRVINIKGKTFDDAQEFSVNLFCRERRDIALHFNPQLDRGYIARNTKLNGRWGVEENSLNGPSPFQAGQEFTLQILVAKDEYRFCHNGRHVCSYKHRVPIARLYILEVNGDVNLSMVRHETVKEFPPPVPPVTISALRHNDQLLSVGHTALLIPTNRPYTWREKIPKQSHFFLGHFEPNIEIGNEIVIGGAVRILPHAFFINLQDGLQMWEQPEVHLHINPRFEDHNHVVLNARLKGKWGFEERHNRCGFQPGQPFTVTVRVDADQYQIYINDFLLASMDHRARPTDINSIYVSGDVDIISVGFNKRSKSMGSKEGIEELARLDLAGSESEIPGTSFVPIAKRFSSEDLSTRRLPSRVVSEKTLVLSEILEGDNILETHHEEEKAGINAETHNEEEKAGINAETYHEEEKAGINAETHHEEEKAGINAETHHEEEKAGINAETRHEEEKAGINAETHHEEEKAGINAETYHEEEKAGINAGTHLEEEKAGINVETHHEEENAGINAETHHEEEKAGINAHDASEMQRESFQPEDEPASSRPILPENKSSASSSWLKESSLPRITGKESQMQIPIIDDPTIRETSIEGVLEKKVDYSDALKGDIILDTYKKQEGKTSQRNSHKTPKQSADDSEPKDKGLSAHADTVLPEDFEPVLVPTEENAILPRVSVSRRNGSMSSKGLHVIFPHTVDSEPRTHPENIAVAGQIERLGSRESMHPNQDARSSAPAKEGEMLSQDKAEVSVQTVPTRTEVETSEPQSENNLPQESTKVDANAEAVASAQDKCLGSSCVSEDSIFLSAEHTLDEGAEHPHRVTFKDDKPSSTSQTKIDNDRNSKEEKKRKGS